MDVHITSKGQVTIPQAIRERYGFMPDTDVEFFEQDGLIAIRSVGATRPDRVDEFLAELTGSGDGALTTDQVMELSRAYSVDA
jgi:AbrB family looped-hinge helix DNA binding protein